MKPPIYKIKARETFVCPFCAWRVTFGIAVQARSMMRQHMKYQHMIPGNRVKLLKP